MGSKVCRNRWFVLFSIFVVAISQLLAFSVLYNSNPASASTNSPPYAPTNASIVPLLQAVQVTWSPPTNDGGYPISEYLIDLDSPDGTVQQVVTSPSTTSYTFNSLYTGQTYFAFIYAISAGGVSAPGTTQDATLTGYPANAGHVVGSVATPDGRGYYEVTSGGYVFTFGDAQYLGSMGGHSLNKPITAMTLDPATGGYWLVGGDGGVFSFNAPFYGNYYTINITWVSDVVGIAAVDGGNDYCISESNGYIHCFGQNASNGSAIYGSPQTQGIDLAKPISGIASTANGQGYWEVAQDGGVFSFGNAPFYGSMGGKPLNAPMVSMALDPASGGYWEVGADGGVFSFNAPFYGSMGGKPLNAPMVSIDPLPIGSGNPGGGYWEAAQDGGVFSFGNAPFYGSAVSAGSSGGGNGGSTNSNTALWGIDSLSTASPSPCTLPEHSSICLSEVNSYLGTPQFYVQYVTYGVSTVLTSSEASYIHSNNTKLILIASPAGINLTTVSQANTDASNAIAAAKALGAPPGTAIFRDIEKGYTVNAGYVETWASTMENSGYIPGFYENPNSNAQGQFSYAYNAAYNANPSVMSKVVLYSDEPQVNSDINLSNAQGTEAEMPTYGPTSPVKGVTSSGTVVPNTTVAWQYTQANYYPGGYGPYGINVDTDEYNGNYANLLW